MTAAANADALVAKPEVLALFGTRGSDPTQAVIKVAEREHIALIAPVNGADAVRESKVVYPVRASYKSEIDGVLRYLDASGGDLTSQQKAVETYLGVLASARGSGPVDALRWGSTLARVSRLTDIPVDELNRRFRGRKATGYRAAASEPAQQAPVAQTVVDKAALSWAAPVPVETAGIEPASAIA